MLLEDRRESVGGSNESFEVESWREADRTLRRIAKRRAALDLEEARWLLIARRTEVHVQLGYGSFLEYLERVLDHAPRTALERIRVAEALPSLPGTRAALAAGRISYSAVRAITRIATPDTESRWLAAADGKTIRELETLFAGRRRGDGPEDDPDPAIEPRKLTLDLTPDVYALFLETRRHLQEETGERLSESDLMRMLCERALSGGERAGCTAARHQVALTVCGTCRRGWQDGAGHTIEVAPGAVDEALCDAALIGRLDAAKPGRTKQAIPPAVRRTVEQRDHDRCVVPGCRAAQHLHMHHIVPRAAGGKNTPSNLILLCSAHHRALHENRLVISGKPPDGLRFTHADGRAYGAPPEDLFADALAALKGLDWPAAEAKRAVERARVHVDANATLPEVIEACLRECAIPGAFTRTP